MLTYGAHTLLLKGLLITFPYHLEFSYLATEE